MDNFKLGDCLVSINNQMTYCRQSGFKTIEAGEFWIVMERITIPDRDTSLHPSFKVSHISGASFLGGHKYICDNFVAME